MTIYIPSTNYFNESRFIVDSTAGEGRFTTIQAAINAASAGETVFIRGGTYTENITLKAGVNLTAFTNDVNQVTISGTITMNAAGTVTISGITCQTNGATAVSFSSANLQNLTFTNCTLTSTNANLMTTSNSNASSNLYFFNCVLSAASTYKILENTNTNNVTFTASRIQGASTTASTSTAGYINAYQSIFTQNFSLTGSAVFASYGNLFFLTNLTALTLGTGTGAFLFGGRIATGNAIPFNITSTGYCYCYNASIETSATTINTGTGTFFNGSNSYTNTAAVTSTSSALVGTAFTKVNVQTFTGNGTYTPTAGMKWCTVEVVGGGGGGGAQPACNASQISASPGGGGGGYARRTISAATIGASQTVTIGTGGAGGTAGGAGGTGGTTTFGALLQATGGGGSAAGTQSTSPNSGGTNLGGSGGIGSLGDVNCAGAQGNSCIVWINNLLNSGAGGNSILGNGGGGLVTSGNGNVGGAYGGGAGGAINTTGQGARNGVAGAAGVCIITEYI